MFHQQFSDLDNFSYCQQTTLHPTRETWQDLVSLVNSRVEHANRQMLVDCKNTQNLYVRINTIRTHKLPCFTSSVWFFSQVALLRSGARGLFPQYIRVEINWILTTTEESV